MIPIQQILPDAVAAAVKKAPLTPEKVAFAWRLAVGQAMANVTSVELREPVLHVSSRDRRWQREIQHAAPLILSRLVAVLGDAVARLNVTVPGAPLRSEGGSSTAPRRR